MEKVQIKTLKMKVETVLENYPETRNDDIALTIQVWRVFHKEKLNFEYVKLSDLVQLPREDNIKRVRAQIQNKEKRFLPTDWEVAKKRQINEENWREAMSRYY